MRLMKNGHVSAFRLPACQDIGLRSTLNGVMDEHLTTTCQALATCTRIYQFKWI